ncbi:hypothetical protein ACF0H5_018639 [Mactra antiquata]
MKSTLFLVVALAFIWNASARTIMFERLTVSSSDQEDNEELLVGDILNDVFNNQLHLVESLPTECASLDSCCITKMDHSLCYKAALLSNGVKLSILFDGHDIWTTVITTPKSLEKCFTDGLPKGVKKACIQVTKIDLAKHYGCVGYKVETSFKTLTGVIGCFQLKTDAAEVEEDAAELTEVIVNAPDSTNNMLEIDSVLKFQRN